MITSLAAYAASSLVAAIWQGAILAVCVGLCLRLLPGLPAAMRSSVWMAVFCAVCVLPLLPVPQQKEPIQPNSSILIIHAGEQWSLALSALWLGCSVFRAGQLMLSVWHLRAVLRRAQPTMVRVSGPAMRRQYQVCVSHDVDRPSVLGFLSPRIFLPLGLMETLKPDELNQVLLHEVEHLRRSDDWTNLLQKLALIVFPLNPVLLWVERRMCVERELACDDAVIRATGARKAYASCLAHLAEQTILRRGLTLALGAWGRRSELARRVQRILVRPGRAMKPAVLHTTAAALMLGVTAGSGMLARSPRLVSFAAPTETAQAASFGEKPVPWPPARLVAAKAEAGTWHGAAEPVMKSAVAVRVTSVRSLPARSQSVRYVSRRNAPGTSSGSSAFEPRMMLSSSPATDGVREQVQEIYFPVVIRVPVAYAAVPTSDGWVLIQL